MANKQGKKRIGVVAPSRCLPEAAATAVARHIADTFDDGSLEVFFHPQCFHSEGHFAGSDAVRTAAFLEVANDPGIDAVWFARGGYGAARLVHDLYDRLGPGARDKEYLGYSDLGVLLAGLQRRGIGRAVHGPMPIDITRENGEAAITRALRWLVSKDDAGLEKTADPSAMRVAFNITVLAHIIGTSSAPELSGRILMLEDIDEYAYALDRSLYAIMTNQAVASCAGVMLGRVSEIRENDPDFGMTPEDIVQYWCERARVPYLGRCDIGHDADNKIVPFS